MAEVAAAAAAEEEEDMLTGLALLSRGFAGAAGSVVDSRMVEQHLAVGWGAQRHCGRQNRQDRKTDRAEGQGTWARGQGQGLSPAGSEEGGDGREGRDAQAW